MDWARRLIVTGLALALAGLLAACGDDPQEATTTSSTATAVTTTTTAHSPNDGGDAPTGDGQGGVDLEQLGEFEQPVYLTQPPSGDDHLYVVEQEGTIQRVAADGGDRGLFLDLIDMVTCCGEQGLLSVAFAPDYAESGLLYVDYTDTEGDSRVVEYRRSEADPATADPASARELVHIDDFASNHNGGLLLFGPDGELYLGMGDGGGGGDPERTGQNLESPLGKLLRIDRGADASYEVAAYGLRNPWRFSFDRETGDLWIGDVGQDSLEEIDAVPAARFESGPPPNFGWSAFEGTERYNDDQEAPDAIPPVFEYGHDEGCSVTGGFVVRDDRLESLWGRYLYGDYCQGELRSFTADPSREATDDRLLGVEVPQLSSFGEDIHGRLYAVSSDGPAYRLVPGG